MTSARTDPTDPPEYRAEPPQAKAAAKVPHRWRNLATMTGVTVIDNGEGSVTTALFPTIAAALRLDTGALGLLSALDRIVAVPFGPFWVWLANKTSKRMALVISTSDPLSGRCSGNSPASRTVGAGAGGRSAAS